MNELIDRFFDLPLRQRVLLTTAITLGVVFVYLSYFYWPLSGDILVKDEQMAGLRQERDRKRAMVANLDEMRRAVADLNAALKQVTSQLPDKKEIPDLLSNVSSLGQESGLEIAVFRTRDEEYQEFYAEVPVEIRVDGSYHQVGTFFDKVGHLSRIVNVNEISMKQPRIKGDAVVVGTSCQATTFRFLDEEERARIAKERAEREKAGKK